MQATKARSRYAFMAVCAPSTFATIPVSLVTVWFSGDLKSSERAFADPETTSSAAFITGLVPHCLSGDAWGSGCDDGVDVQPGPGRSVIVSRALFATTSSGFVGAEDGASGVDGDSVVDVEVDVVWLVP